MRSCRPTRRRVRLIKQFINYALTGGQQFGPRLDFAPLPSGVKNAALRTLNSIQ